MTVNALTTLRLARRIGSIMSVGSQRKILLVDDNKQIRSINATRLIAGGYQVREAGDGIEALKQLKEELPDLIILDLMMPVMDGYKVLQVVKTNSQTRDIPVIVLSGKGQPEEIEKALKLGANDFLNKMRTNPNVLLEKVKQSLAAGNGQTAVPHYHLAVKEQIFDAPKIALDFNLPADFHCPKCGAPLILELIPDFSHHEPWFTGHFVCTQCR